MHLRNFLCSLSPFSVLAPWPLLPPFKCPVSSSCLQGGIPLTICSPGAPHDWQVFPFITPALIYSFPVTDGHPLQVFLRQFHQDAEADPGLSANGWIQLSAEVYCMISKLECHPLRTLSVVRRASVWCM